MSVGVVPGTVNATASSRQTQLYILLTVMVVFWSSNFIVSKVALRRFPDLLLVGMRTALACVFMVPVYRWHGRKSRRRWSRGELPKLVVLGFIGVALNQMFFVLGMARTSVGHASILVGLIPLMVLAISALVGHEKLTIAKLAGIATAIAGVSVLQLGTAKGTGSSFLGDLFISLSGLTFALYTVFGKKFTQTHGAVTITTFAYWSGTLLLSPVTLTQAAGFAFSRVDWIGWAALLYMAAFPSVVCYLIYFYALTYMPASRVSAFSYLQPLIATMMAIPILHEHITVYLIGGGALVLAGVYLTERA